MQERRHDSESPTVAHPLQSYRYLKFSGENVSMRRFSIMIKVVFGLALFGIAMGGSAVAGLG